MLFLHDTLWWPIHMRHWQAPHNVSHNPHEDLPCKNHVHSTSSKDLYFAFPLHQSVSNLDVHLAVRLNQPHGSLNLSVTSRHVLEPSVYFCYLVGWKSKHSKNELIWSEDKEEGNVVHKTSQLLPYNTQKSIDLTACNIVKNFIINCTVGASFPWL